MVELWTHVGKKGMAFHRQMDCGAAGIMGRPLVERDS